MGVEEKGENGGNGGKLDFTQKKDILTRYMDRDIADSIPDSPAFIPGIGHTPTLKGLADDTFRIITEHWGDRLGDAMLEQMNRILSIK